MPEDGGSRWGPTVTFVGADPSVAYAVARKLAERREFRKIGPMEWRVGYEDSAETGEEARSWLEAELGELIGGNWREEFLVRDR